MLLLTLGHAYVRSCAWDPKPNARAHAAVFCPQTDSCISTFYIGSSLLCLRLASLRFPQGGTCHSSRPCQTRLPTRVTAARASTQDQHSQDSHSVPVAKDREGPEWSEAKWATKAAKSTSMQDKADAMQATPSRWARMQQNLNLAGALLGLG